MEEYRKHGTNLPAGKYSALEFHQNDRSVREVIKRGNRYRLVELLELDGGKTEEVRSNQMIFSLGDDAQIDGIGMIDSPTKLVFSKTDLGGTELPGAQIEILDRLEM